MEARKIEKISEILRNETNIKILLFLERNKSSFYKLKKECVDCPPSLINSIRKLLKNGLIGFKRENGKKIYKLTKKGEKLIEIIKKLEFL